MEDRSDELEGRREQPGDLVAMARGQLERAGVGEEIPYVEVMAPTPVPETPEPGRAENRAVEEEGAPDEDIKSARLQIEETRADMGKTIDAIQQRLSPSHLAREAKDTVREATIGKVQRAMNEATDTTAGFGSTIVETIRQNPIPAAVAGIGLGWLIASGRRSAPHRYSNGRSYRFSPEYEYGGQTTDGSGLEQTLGQAQSTVGRAQDTVQQAIGQAQDTAQSAVNQVQD